MVFNKTHKSGWFLVFLCKLRLLEIINVNDFELFSGKIKVDGDKSTSVMSVDSLNIFRDVVSNNKANPITCVIRIRGKSPIAAEGKSMK